MFLFRQWTPVRESVAAVAGGDHVKLSPRLSSADLSRKFETLHCQVWHAAGGHCSGSKRPTDISLGIAKLYLKYKEAAAPFELHIYPKPGHGFGFRPTTTTAAGAWQMRLREWLVDSKLITE